MKTLAIAFLVVLVVFAAATDVVTPRPGQIATSRTDAREFVRRIYFEGIPVEASRRLDPDTAVPTLLGMLADPREERYWSNIVITLGMMGDERAVEPLMQFLEQGPAGQRLSSHHFVAKCRVLMALGYLVNRNGNQKALDYLKSSLNPGQWQRRGLKWVSPHHPSADGRDYQLTDMSILGLALSGRPEAGEALHALQQPATNAADKQFRARVSDVVQTALSAHGEIARDGLVKYDLKKTQPRPSSPRRR